jgi:hypothetical protein
MSTLLLAVAISFVSGNPVIRYYNFQLCGEHVSVVLGEDKGHVHGMYWFKTVGAVDVGMDMSALTPDHMRAVYIPVYSRDPNADTALHVEVRDGGKKVPVRSGWTPYPMMLKLPLPQGMCVRWFTVDIEALRKAFVNHVLGPEPWRFWMSDSQKDYNNKTADSVMVPVEQAFAKVGFTIEVEYDQPLYADTNGKAFMYTPVIPHQQATGKYEMCIESPGGIPFTLDQDSSKAGTRRRCVPLTHLRPVVATLKLSGSK